jgi:hypothetical protein
MSVQAEDSGPHPDPAATAALPVVPDPGQGVLFHDAHGYPTFGDTDKIPAVTQGRARGRAGPRAPRWLRLAVVLVSVVIAAAAAVLGLVKSGIIDGSGNGGNQAATGTSRSTLPTTPNTPLLTSTGPTASGAQGYTIPAHAYRITVTTSVGRSWVSIGAVGQHPIFAGIVPPNSSQREILLGPGQVQVGAGGTKVIVSSGRHSQILTPPSAPFSYQITPA